jgi:hypothetical protein
MQRVCAKPKLVEHYPHAKEHLSKTQLDDNDQLRIDAKAAMEQYLRVEAINNLPPEMQDLHDRIAGRSNLSDKAKLVLLITTFIPHGRYTN